MCMKNTHDGSDIQGLMSEREQYDNEYCWVYQCRDGKIAKIEEYADTLKAARIFKWV